MTNFSTDADLLKWEPPQPDKPVVPHRAFPQRPAKPSGAAGVVKRDCVVGKG